MSTLFGYQNHDTLAASVLWRSKPKSHQTKHVLQMAYKRLRSAHELLTFHQHHIQSIHFINAGSLFVSSTNILFVQ
jgi:hypothetical protein